MTLQKDVYVTALPGTGVLGTIYHLQPTPKDGVRVCIWNGTSYTEIENHPPFIPYPDVFGDSLST